MLILCRQFKKKNIPYVNMRYNNLHPNEIPSCLKGLTLMEKRLISKIHVFLTVIVLPGGQYAEKGMAINFPSNVTETASMLPQKFSNCNIITVSFGEHKDLKTSHLVRKKHIFKSLRWLQSNNALYKNVTLDIGAISKLVDINEIDEFNSVESCEEFGVIDVDYSVPNIDLHTVEKIKSFQHLNIGKVTGKPVMI